jgi:hypothetical protein
MISMAVYNNPYLNMYNQQPMYQQPAYQPPQPAYQPPQPVDWDSVAKACQTLATAASNVPGGGEYVTKADLEKLKTEILEGVKAIARSSV